MSRGVLSDHVRLHTSSGQGGTRRDDGARSVNRGVEVGTAACGVFYSGCSNVQIKKTKRRQKQRQSDVSVKKKKQKKRGSRRLGQCCVCERDSLMMM